MKKIKKHLIVLSMICVMVIVSCLNVQAATTLSAPKSVKVTSSSKYAGTPLIRWSKVSNASGYQIYRSTSKNGTYKRVATISNRNTLAFYNKNLKAGKYYYKVRSYRKAGDKNTYSKYTNPIGLNLKCIDITRDYLSSQRPDMMGKFNTIKNRIGGMTKKYNSRYPAFYAAGNHMIIGVNYNAKYSRNENYVFVRNTGNNGVSILGVRRGMSAAEAGSILRQNGLYSYRIPNEYYWGNAGTLTLDVKEGIVRGYTYRCAPTCD